MGALGRSSGEIIGGGIGRGAGVRLAHRTPLSKPLSNWLAHRTVRATTHSVLRLQHPVREVATMVGGQVLCMIWAK